MELTTQQKIEVGAEVAWAMLKRILFATFLTMVVVAVADKDWATMAMGIFALVLIADDYLKGVVQDNLKRKLHDQLSIMDIHIKVDEKGKTVMEFTNKPEKEEN